MRIRRTIRQVKIEYQLPGGNSVDCNTLVEVLDDSDNIITASATEEKLKDTSLVLSAQANKKNTWDEVEVLAALQTKYPKDEILYFKPATNDEE